MGLCNAPATFQRMVNEIFREEIKAGFMSVYLDDILIFSNSQEEHEIHVRRVFDRLRTSKLYAKLKKCEFNKDELKFLGLIVKKGTIKPNPKKVEVVRDWPTPCTKHDLRQFLGLTNYSKKFIQGYASITRSLYGLLQDSQPNRLSWSDSHEKSFNALKSELTSAPVLQLPDFDKPFTVVSDAFDFAVGAVLLQDDHPVAYASRKLNSAELNYPTGEKELLGVKYSLEQFRHYLLGVHFTLITDHKPNTTINDQIDISSWPGRKARWAEYFQQYDFTFIYKPGTTNIADPVSRRPDYLSSRVATLQYLKHGCQDPSWTVEPNTGVVSDYASKCESGTPLQHAEMAAITRKRQREIHTQSSGPSTSSSRAILRDLNSVAPPVVDSAGPNRPAGSSLDGVNSSEMPNAVHVDDGCVHDLIREFVCGYATPEFASVQSGYSFANEDGLLYHDDNLVVPTKALQSKLLHELHDSPYTGHVGVRRTLSNFIRAKLWWPDRNKDVAAHVKACHSCQVTKALNTNNKGKLTALEIPDGFGLWKHISLDFITDLPLTEAGYDTIITVVDKFSKMCILIPTSKSVTGEDCAQLLHDHVFTKFGWPEKIISDRDPRFTGAFWQRVHFLNGTRLGMSSAFHPQTDGQTEVYNRILEDMLRHYVSPQLDNWDIYLSCAEFAINNGYVESIKTTPFFLNYGRHPDTPLHLRLLTYNQRSSNPIKAVPTADSLSVQLQERSKAARESLQLARQRMVDYANKNRADIQYHVGDQVLLSTRNLTFKGKLTKKLMPRWIGPFTVTHKIGPVAYRLDLPSTVPVYDVFHVSLLRNYTASGRQPPPLPELIDGEEEYEVERILDHRVNKRGKKSFLIRWLGYGPEHDSWVPMANLDNCPDLLDKYWNDSALASKRTRRAVRH